VRMSGKLVATARRRCAPSSTFGRLLLPRNNDAASAGRRSAGPSKLKESVEPGPALCRAIARINHDKLTRDAACSVGEEESD
jgi:hypothetical protein